MPGDDWQKFANVRLLYSYMIASRAKNFSLWEENWTMERVELQRGAPLVSAAVSHITHFKEVCQRAQPFSIKTHSALWEHDFEGKGFEWIDFSDRKNSVISYLRKGKGHYLACVHNFTPHYFSEYFVCLHNIAKIREVFNTDGEEYGGSGKINGPINPVRDETGRAIGFKIQLAPLATQFFEVEFVY